VTAYSEFLGKETFAIFLFHGVMPEPRPGVRNYTGKHLTLEKFEATLDDFAAQGEAVTMDDIALGRPLPPRAYAVTFDDGFRNNSTVAAPALRRRGIPATIYVTTAFIDDNGASWIDLIEEAVEAAPAFELDLPFGRRAGESREAKTALLDEMRAYVKAGNGVDPYAFAADARAQLGAGPLRVDPILDQKLDWDEVRALDGDGLFTIGGHGHTHRVLEHLDDDALASELDTSLARLRAQLGHDVVHYSYPEGLEGCYSPRLIAQLRARGIRCAPTAEPGVNALGDAPFLLTRIAVV
jgi:peptidoglycan/xylan/chitin deacetylase (PgdA/CDA1 family)